MGKWNNLPQPDYAPTWSIFDHRIQLYPEQRLVRADAVTMRLGKQQFGLFALLASNVDQTLSDNYLFDEIWGSPFYTMKNVGVSVYFLRNRLGRERLGNLETGVIRTVRGVGYMAVSSQSIVTPQGLSTKRR